MNLKLRRLVRTPSSEQYALFDLDCTDDDFDPVSIGKIDLHFTAGAVYGTFLLWKERIGELPQAQVRALVESTLHELCEPMGLPTFYAVEFLSPDLDTYTLHSNEEENDRE
jgi:hypothetical protein